jgi:hypothetical protein
LPGTLTIPDQIVDNRKPYFDALDAADLALRDGRVDVSKMEELLARISHRNKRIEAPNQRKLFCENHFSMIRGEPRCRQSVAQNGLILESLKGALWMLPSMLVL